MKKSIISAVLLLIMMISLGYVIQQSKTQKMNLLMLNGYFEKVKLMDKEFDLYLTNNVEYTNFDLIEEKVEQFNNNMDQILQNKILNEMFPVQLNKLKKDSQTKVKKILRSGSYRAILNNSFRILQKLKKKIETKKFDDLYVSILILDKNSEINTQNMKQDIKKLIFKDKYEQYFLQHATIFLNYFDKLEELNSSVQQLGIGKQFVKIHSNYKEDARSAMKNAHLSIGILFTLLTSLIILYLVYAFKLIISNNDLSRFKKTVENSDNIVVVTDKNQTIKYVNEEFTKTTGYTSKEAIGKKPSILKSGQQSKEFYQKLNETIHSGNKWSGEFINVDKNGELSYEKASITPVFDDDGDIKEFIAIKLDITNETIKSQQLKEKEKLLAQQSKMAAMGEMLENIAHQWRQPLSSISTMASGILVKKEFGMMDEKEEINTLNEINDTVQYLSDTIDDFRDFFKSNKEKCIFDIEQTYNRALKIISSKFNANSIEVIETIFPTQAYGFENELIQVIMNILNNARDVLQIKKDQRRILFVNIFQEKDKAVLQFKDNGGGIPEDILEKVFDPYFTTKHKSQGTGIGLYMSYEMITKHMEGTLKVENTNYEYDDVHYEGACFTITLPLK